MQLAEEDLRPQPWWRRLLPLAAVLALVALGWLAWWAKSQLTGEVRPQRQIARIAVLPDVPPPPPPPPKVEPRPPPKEAPKPDAQDKPKEADTAQPLKMEGAAGSGPSAFQAGTVTQEYSGAPPPAPAPPPPSPAERLTERLYAQSARQQIAGEIERHLRSEAVEFVASFALWLRSDGTVERFEVLPGETPRHDEDLRAALDGAARTLRLPAPPPALPQPLRFRLTVRPLG
jgi:hypothetical protein